jgi:uncharacterized protein (DUF305 family)
MILYACEKAVPRIASQSIGGDMTNQRIIPVVFVGVTLVSSFPSGYAVNALTDAHSESQAKSTCSDGLRRAMDDMHAQMQMVKPTGNVDEDFVRLMLPHHRAAIEMAKVELLCGQDKVNRRLAQEIVTDQESEIELMSLWLKQHGLASPNLTRPKPSERKEH